MLNEHRTILYVSYDGMTDPLGQSQVLPYLIGLSRKGYKFVLLSCEKPEVYNKNRSEIEQLLVGTSIEWAPLPYTKNPPVLSTLFDYWKLKRKAVDLHATHNFGLVHCRSYIPAMIGLYLQKMFGVKFLFDMRGFWADERVDGGLWNLNNPVYNQIYKFFKRKEKAFLENADHIVSLTHAGKKEMNRWGHIERSNLPVSIIPCCVDTGLFDKKHIQEADVLRIRSQLGIRDEDKVLTYLGSIGTWYLLDEMLAFFRVYLTKFPGGKFVFITRDSAEHIRKRAETLGIPYDRLCITAAKRNEVPIYASLGAFSLFFIKPAFSKKSSSPTKQGELMSLGISVVCNAGVGDTDWIISKYDSGLIVGSLDDETYGAVIDKMSSTKFEAEKIRYGAQDYFELDTGVSSYAQIYENLLT